MKMFISCTFCLCLNADVVRGQLIANPSSLLFVATSASNVNMMDVEKVEGAPLFKTMFEHVEKKDLKSLEKLRSKVDAQKSVNISAVYALALYAVAPIKYKKQYVAKFPVDLEGLNYFVMQRERGDCAAMFSNAIGAIGGIAEEGDKNAIRKVLINIGNSDGEITELFCGTLGRLLEKQFQKTVCVLSGLDIPKRQKAYGCFEMMNSKELSIIENNIAAAKSNNKVLNEIAEALK